MALYLRGNTWWFEIRDSRSHIRKSTGLPKNQKAKAKAVFEAARLAHRAEVPRSLVEGMLNSIYGVADAGRVRDGDAASLDCINELYMQWQTAKARKVSKRTDGTRRVLVEKFTAWAKGRGVAAIPQVTAAVAREYAAELRKRGLSNKTQRNMLATLGGVWRAIGDTVPGIHNPWPGVIPDRDGSAVRRGAFTPEQEAAVLAECERAGHGWKLASMISRWTALRYGDVARLEWGQIDMEARTIAVTPSKTARHGVRLTLPIADALYEELARTGAETRVGYVFPEMAMAYPRAPASGSFREILDACGLDAEIYTFHSWRHTCASRLSESGAPTEMLRRFGGWTSDRMANHYDHAERLAEMRAAIERTAN